MPLICGSGRRGSATAAATPKIPSCLAPAAIAETAVGPCSALAPMGSYGSVSSSQQRPTRSSPRERLAGLHEGVAHVDTLPAKTKADELVFMTASDNIQHLQAIV